MPSKNTLIILTSLFLIGAGFFFSKWNAQNSKKNEQTIAPVLSETIFVCSNDKKLTAKFSDGIVTLDLPDSRSFTLLEKTSTSGTRYANEGDEIVFWNKGDTTFLEEKGVEILSNCIAEAPELI
jgi:membrane-bound inhibitor of C-type lysozyme